MIGDGRFEVVLRRFTHDANERVMMQKTVHLPFAPAVGMELCVSAECTFIVDEVRYSLERGTFRAIDRTDRHGKRRRASLGTADAWRDAGFEVGAWPQEGGARSLLHVVREGPPNRRDHGAGRSIAEAFAFAEGALHQEKAMNDVYREFKARLHRLDDILAAHGLTHVAFAQAVSRVHRAERHGDRSREPSKELQTLLQRAEGLAPSA